MKKIKFAPRKTFQLLLKWAVMPTFDLIIEYGDQGVIMVKRTIAPYKNQWALPGLRMFKGDGIDDVLIRIADQELGLTIDPSKKKFLGQFVGKFTTEHGRQDLSTGYLLDVSSVQPIELNTDHFSSLKYITSASEIPKNTGAMYKYYLHRYFDL